MFRVPTYTCLRAMGLCIFTLDPSSLLTPEWEWCRHGLTGARACRGEAGISLRSSPFAPGCGGPAGAQEGEDPSQALPCSCLGQVSEMQKLDAQVKELVLKSAVEAERLVAGKLKKDTYIENEKLISGKRQELVTKIDHILDAL